MDKGFAAVMNIPYQKGRIKKFTLRICDDIFRGLIFFVMCLVRFASLCLFCLFIDIKKYHINRKHKDIYNSYHILRPIFTHE